MKRKIGTLLLIAALLVTMLAATAQAEGQITSKKKRTMSLPKKMTITVGFSGCIDLDEYGQNAYWGLPDDVKFRIGQICRLDYSELDYSELWIDALKTGTTTLTMSSKSLKQTKKCKVTVKANTYTRKKPLKYKNETLHISVNKLHYDGADLVVKLFVLNKTGKTIYQLTDIEGILYTIDGYGDMQLARENLNFGSWIPKGGKLKKNKYATMTVTIPNVLDEYADPFDLRQLEVLPGVSACGVVFDRNAVEKRFRTKAIAPGAPGVSEDERAQPEDAYRSEVF